MLFSTFGLSLLVLRMTVSMTLLGCLMRMIFRYFGAFLELATLLSARSCCRLL